MAKVIENTSIAEHNAEALIISTLADFDQKDTDWIKAHYEGIESTLADLAAEPEWTVGKIFPMEFHDSIDSSQARRVIFIQIYQNGKPVYEGLRQCIQKIANNAASKIKAKHFAMGRTGCVTGGLHVGGIEPVVAASEHGGGKDDDGKSIPQAASQLIMVDIYRGTV